MAAQRARRDRIEARVRERLAALRATPGGAARRSVHRLPHARRSALPRPRPRRQRSPPGQRLGRRARGQLQRQRDGPDDVADRVPVAVVVGVARRRAREPGEDLGAGAAPHLHRRPEHVPEHARRLARAPAASASGTSTSSAATTTSPAAPTCRCGSPTRSPPSPRRYNAPMARRRGLEVRTGVRAAELAVRRAARPRRARAAPLSGRHRRRAASPA